MPRYKDEPPAVRVYTVCDESRYLIVRNVPALGCGAELLKLFATYGDVEDCKPMDAEDCEPYTDVYWIKFRLFSNARFAKRKLDEFAFLGNRLQVSYAPQFESASDTKEKLETRRKEVLARVNSSASTKQFGAIKSSASGSQETMLGSEWNSSQPEFIHHLRNNPLQRVSTQQDYFASPSMNRTVGLVREKLDKIESSGNKSLPAEPSSKKARVDNRRRI
ncbi:hypothetical protein MLD38_012389 [Melastoma candidum]|uniref:Uncharacterized protein n=1 Tax=Melastoma candidum TaxID=119954 RepID=A0ACB9R7G2_9MYRT|nr:hypothetical protein MLD38_012389 [Melastoma candidum]